jgi:hypothetical protein
MNVFNRIVVILLILILMILIPLGLIFPEQAQATLRTGANIIQLNVDWLNGLTPQREIAIRAVLSVAGLVIFLIGLLLLVLEFVRFRRRTVRLRDGSGELTTNGIAEHLGYYIDLLPDVVRVQPAIKSKGKSVSATLFVETAPGINVPEKSSQIRDTARYVLEDQLGLQVRDEIRVVIRPSSFPEKRGVGEEIPPIIAEARKAKEAEAAPGHVPVVATGEVVATEEVAPTEAVTPTEEVAEAEEVAPEELAAASTEGGQADEDEIVEGETFEFKAPAETEE